MWALAQREKPYKQVNVPGQASDNASPPAPGILTQTAHGMDTRLPLDVNEKLLTGDALARFVSARFDPDAPSQAFSFDDEDAMMELELISTGGDPDLEAEKQALMAAHPEGKAIKTIRNGARAPAVIPRDEPPPKKPPDTG